MKIPHESEIKNLHNAVLVWMQRWSDVEIAMSTLLYETLHILPRSSQISYAIYFSPDGFDARMKIVDHVIRQFIQENTACNNLQDHWDDIKHGLGSARRIRNGVAHGSAIMLNIRGKSYVRHCPPGFDIHRVANTARKGTIPGLSVKDITDGSKMIIVLVECIGAMNRAITSFHDNGRVASKERYDELTHCLQRLPNRRPIVRKPAIPLNQPRSSSE